MKFGTKVTNLRYVYWFQLLLKKKMIECNKILGKQFDPEQTMHILWTSLDARSREIAASEKLDEKEYKDMYDHIDRRRRAQPEFSSKPPKTQDMSYGLWKV